jgi:hypothetical protein
MKRLGYLMLPLFLCGFVIHDESKLIWTDERLTWSDFRAEPDNTAFGAARTAVKISARPYRKNKKLEYKVVAYFLRDHSWCKSKSVNLLNHEQGHFDLAELYARKTRQKIFQLQQSNTTDYRVYNKAIQVILDESNAMDELYDRETLNGSILKKQIEWDLGIQREIQMLNGFQ